MLGIETERKFLVRSDEYKLQEVESHRLTQGYICRESGRTVRVRIADDRAWLTIKGKSSEDGISRSEWEYAVPVDEARQMLSLCDGGIIDKTRHIVPASGGRFWEVDEFHGDNAPLVIAEIELSSPQEEFTRPEWLGEEVTAERRYYNSMLSVRPYSEWK